MTLRNTTGTLFELVIISNNTDGNQENNLPVRISFIAETKNHENNNCSNRLFTCIT